MRYKKNSFIIVPNINYLKGKDPKLQALYFWICNHANEDGICFPSRKLLAEEAGITIRKVDEMIKVLVDDNVLEKVKRKKTGTNENMSNLYQIMIKEEDREVVLKLPLPSANSSTTPSVQTAPVTITNINYNNLTNSNAETSSAEVSAIIKCFETINPASSKFYGNKTQRAACQFLIQTYGFDRVVSVIERTLPITNGMKYFPTIISPSQLQDKWAVLESAIIKQKSEVNTGRGFA